MGQCVQLRGGAHNVVAESIHALLEVSSQHWQGLLHCKCVAVAAVMGHAIVAEVVFDSQYWSGVMGLVTDDMPNRVESLKELDSEELHWGVTSLLQHCCGGAFC